MATIRPVPMWQRAVIVLSGTVVALVIVLGLQWGRPILVPIALAVLLTFLLNPVVRAMERRGFGRAFSAMAAVAAAGIILLCVGWMVTSQVTGMLTELPKNTANIKAKVKMLRELVSGPITNQFGQMVEEINQEAQLPAGPDSSGESQRPASQDVRSKAPGETVVVTEQTPWLAITGYLTSAFEVLVTLGFALVLLIFFLFGREGLRDRILLLAGKARLTITVKALEDAGDRISRYLVRVAAVNGGFGVVLTGGLFLLGVPYALLWGFLAAALRFIPYIGAWIGAVFPIAMCLATSEGWWQPLAVFAFVLTLELITNNAVEPLIFGRSTGVSPVALLISAAFWLYIWGPIGLVLSAPFAVCLMVLGKNIPQLGFLNLLLGDDPVLDTNLTVYQRLMLGDEPDAVRCVMQRLKELPPEQVYDEMLVPALNFTRRDIQRDHVTGDDQRKVVLGMRESLRQIGESLQATQSQKAVSKFSSSALKPTRILGCPATDDIDRVGLEMLRQLLNPDRWTLEISKVRPVTSIVADHLAENSPAVICIASLPPGGLAQARSMCQQFRRAAPGALILVGRWGWKRNGKIERERLEHAGASFVTTSMVETLRLLEAAHEREFSQVLLEAANRRPR